MEAQIAQFLNRGMNQDISVSKASNEFAYKNYNIRITAVNDNTLLSVSNEKGPLKLDVIIRYGNETFKEIRGKYLGHGLTSNYIILFTKDDFYDYIYKLEYVNNRFEGEVKFRGDLKFLLDYPIDTLSFYENDNVQKVYWVDGFNPPRYINIEDPNTLNKDATQFEFTPPVKKFPKVNIVKNYSDGLFPSGVIQYFISYYNKYGSETGILWASDLQYITQVDRGESADNTVVCKFTIDINNIDTSFGYLRVYSLQRTSLNATPTAKIVIDTAITGTDITVDDTNYIGDSIDPSSLLFLGGDKFIASTIARKDNTVFFGNIKTIEHTEVKGIKDYIVNNIKKDINGVYDSPFIEFDRKSFEVSEDSLFQLEHSSNDIKTFKRGEIYRFAIQFQDNTGKWTTPIWVGDKKCEIFPSVSKGIIEVASATFCMSKHPKLLEEVNKHYVNYRLLMAEANISDRSIIAQGIVSPTVFNHAERVNNNGPYSIASWMIRPRGGNAQYEHLSGLGNVVDINSKGERVYNNTPTCEIQNSIERFPLKIKSASTSSRGRLYTVGYVVSIKIDSKTSAEVSIIKTVSGNLVKRSETSTGTYNHASEILESDLVNVALQEVVEIRQTSEEDPYGYKDITDIVNTFFKEDNDGLPNITLEDYNYYIENFTGIKEINDKWAAGYFESSTLFTKHDSDKDSVGLYTFKTRGESESNNNTDDVEYSDYTSNYYVDSSIVNFYSPDLENNYAVLHNAEYKFKIVGIAPIKSTFSDILLETNTPGISDFSGLEKINIDNNSNKSLFKEALFKDYGWDKQGRLNKFAWTTYYVYMWNKKGSIIGQTSDTLDYDGEQFTSVWADLKHKVISNHRKSNTVKYFNTETEYTILPTVFNSDVIESKVLKLNNKNVVYQGNYENLVSIPTDEFTSYKYKVFYQTAHEINRNNGRGGIGDSSSTPSDRIYNYNDIDQVDPVHIKYNTTPHAVFELKDSAGTRKILPYLADNGESKWNIFEHYPFVQEDNTKEYSYPWLDSTSIYTQDSITNVVSEDDNTERKLPYIYIGEVYRSVDYNNLYGGYDDNALERIRWVPASMSTSVYEDIKVSSGDTYYQKWDCLTTYPASEGDMNSVVDITTFMVETHINIDGRYDKNKDIINTINARRSNYNKINSVYSNSDNFFNYAILDDKFNTTTKYENQVVFSLSKVAGSDIDTWTNITLSSAFNLNGLYGKLNKIINFNDTLITFQDKAISTINYNNRTALSTESGVPIEIANSGKVNGFTVISDNIGCINKHSISHASSGIYFIDDLNKALYRFNKEGINNLSSKGLSQWFKNNLSKKEHLFYDSITHDIYIVNDNDCVLYNEDLQEFTSFMDYNGMDLLFNLSGSSFAIKYENNSSVYEMFKGRYNTTFKSNTHGGYSVEYKVNPEPLIDKTFGSIEYLADCIPEDVSIDTVGLERAYPFNKLEVWNEYQRGETAIKNKYRYPNFEKKFRVWRVDIPRDESNGRDRIRNPWIYLKLSKSPIDDNKTVFHNLLVKYYK